MLNCVRAPSTVEYDLMLYNMYRDLGTCSDDARVVQKTSMVSPYVGRYAAGPAYYQQICSGIIARHIEVLKP